MRKLTWVTGLVTVGATAVAVPAHGASSAALTDCVGKALHHPSSYTVACGDGNHGFQKLKWSHWGSSKATATGTGFSNTCDPDCARGSFVKYPVTLTASTLRNGRYLRLVATASGSRPKGVSKREVYSIKAKYGPFLVSP